MDAAPAPLPVPADVAQALLDAGWHPIPLPARTKGPPPDGTTGTNGVDLSAEQVAALTWHGNIAVRAGIDQLGVDVDAYAGGLDTLRRLVAELGPLPRTVVSHSGRDDGSGIYWYRVPVGVRWVGGLPGIQIIQRHHRYAVVWPSTHPDHGGTYGWWDQTEEAPCLGVPRAEDRPELPWPWIEHLTRGPLADGATSAGIAPPGEVAAFVDAHVAGRATRYLSMVVDYFAGQVALGLSRHDTMTHCLAWSMTEARAGDYPAARALDELGAAWQSVMDVPRRAVLSAPPRATEWQAMVGWAVRRAQALTGPELLAIVDDHQGPQIDEEAEPSPEAEAEAEQPPADFFGRNGIRALKLAHAIIALGPTAMGDDHLLWRYDDGTWLPDGERIVHARCVELLGQRVRGSHVSTALLVLRSVEPTIHAEQPEQWVNCRNGLLEWRTGELTAHTPDVRSTYQLQTDWRPGATCPTVDRWLAEVVEEDCVDLVWEIVGMAVYAGPVFHRAVMLAGPGRNGKGTLLRLVEALVGTRYCAGVTLQQLAEDRFASAQLFAKTVNLAGDLDARAISSTGTFKMATGGDIITAQRKYGQPFEFTSRALLVFSANELPVARDHTLGYESRWVVVPFTRVTLKPDEEDKTLEQRMHGELAGVLVRAVDGMRRALARGGFDRPASVIAATEEFHRSSNPLHAFAEECLDVTGSPNDDVARPAVYDAYTAWCRRSGHRPLAVRRFWRELEAIDEGIDTGITPERPHGHRFGQTPIVCGVAAIHHPGFTL